MSQSQKETKLPSNTSTFRKKVYTDKEEPEAQPKKKPRPPSKPQAPLKPEVVSKVLEQNIPKPKVKPNTPRFGVTDDMIKSAFSEKADQEYIIDFMNQLGKDACSICGGYGHLPNVCATKKNLDKAFKAHGLGHEWGVVKSSYITEAAKTAREAKANLLEHK